MMKKGFMQLVFIWSRLTYVIFSKFNELILNFALLLRSHFICIRFIDFVLLFLVLSHCDFCFDLIKNKLKWLHGCRIIWLSLSKLTAYYYRPLIIIIIITWHFLACWCRRASMQPSFRWGTWYMAMIRIYSWSNFADH